MNSANFPLTLQYIKWNPAVLIKRILEINDQEVKFMTKITVEDFNRLSPKDIREWFGLGPVTRIIRYFHDGQFKHRKDALKTINFWLRFHLTEENLEAIFWVIPFLIEQFPAEKKVIRYEIGVTLYLFLENKVVYDDETIELITDLIKKEKDEKVKSKLEFIILRNDWQRKLELLKKSYRFFLLKDKLDRTIIKDSKFYKEKLPFKPRRKEEVKPENIMCVYFLQEKEKGYIKVGKTKNLKTKIFFPYKMPFKWEVIHVIESLNVDSLEKFFHKKYKDNLINGEWFNLSNKDIAEIKMFQTK